MPINIVRALAAAGFLASVSLAYAFSTGPAASRTGAAATGGVAAESDCASCHSDFTLNDGPGRVEILDLPSGYAPSQSYVLRVRVAQPTSASVASPAWGFQITAVQASNGKGVGKLTLPPAGAGPSYSDSLLLKTGSGVFSSRQYVEHSTFSTRAGIRDSAEWHLTWTSPSSDVGKICFFVAGNATNGNGTSSGDYIYATSATISAISTAAVDPALAGGLELRTPYPNPFSREIALSYAIARAGHADLAVYDVSGRRVATLLSGHVEAGPGCARWNGRRDDGSNASNGIYFARLRAADGMQTAARRLLLER